MAIRLGTGDCHEKMTRLDATGVDIHTGDLNLRITKSVEHLYMFEQFIQFHIYTLLLYYSKMRSQTIPCLTAVPE